MANYFIFGIGGTGSRVIRSLTMLLGAGFSPFKANDRILPILIDYDTKNGDTTRAKNLIDLYHEINAAAYPDALRDEERFNGLFFSTRVQQMSELGKAYKGTFTMQFGTDSSQTFEQWTAADHLVESKRNTYDLMNSLYDDSSDPDNAELKLKMDVGFKGNPNIGSIVFHSLKEAGEFNDFASLCQKGDKVIIVGSLFGGTGSSGIPELVQAIRTHNKPEVKAVDLSVVMVCPYFEFRSTDERAVRSSIFKSKTKAALNFYASSGINDMINAIYYVGDNNSSTFSYCEGGENQKNAIHIVDLISALSICHFAEQPHTGSTRYMKYRMSELDKDEMQTNENDESNQSHGLNFTNFIDTELDRVFYPLASFALALRFFHDEVANNTKVVKELDWYHGNTLDVAACFEHGRAITSTTDNKETNDLRICCNGLMEFYELFKLWNEEFKSHSKHGLFMFNFDPSKAISEFIVEGSLRIPANGFLNYGAVYLEMEKDVAECTKNAWNKLKAVSSFGVDSKYKAFLLMSVLTNGCREIFLDKRNSRTERRRKTLAGKTIKVETETANT